MLRFPFTRSNNSKKASNHRVATSDPQTSKEILAKLKERYPKEHFDMKLNWDEDPVIFGSVPFFELALPCFLFSVLYYRIDSGNGHGVFYYTSEAEFEKESESRLLFNNKMRYVVNDY